MSRDTLDCQRGRRLSEPFHNGNVLSQITTAPKAAGGTLALTQSYSYDGSGQRVKKVAGSVTTLFVYNVAGQLIAEYTSPDQATASGTSYLTSDTLGSTRVVTNASGVVKARYDYLPYGEEIGASIGGRSGVAGYGGADTTRQKYTAKERDAESGLDYFLARYYSSAQGRFTSPDEFTGGPDELFDFVDIASVNPTFYADLRTPQSLNKYQYGYNNPFRYVDPNGHEAEETDPDPPQQRQVAPPDKVTWPPPYGHNPNTAQKRVEWEESLYRCNQGDINACEVIMPTPPEILDPSINVPKSPSFKSPPTPTLDHPKKKQSTGKSKKNDHEYGKARNKRDRGGERGDENRRPPRKRPDNWKGPWPPKPPKVAEPPKPPKEQPPPGSS